MGKIKVTIAYDGGNYHGFQEQRGASLLTIQGVLEERLKQLAHKPIQIAGAGRTDAGVHARGQVISFAAADWPVPAARTVPALNSLLPRDIAALAAAELPDSFHARFSAQAKTYRYTIYNGKWPSPFYRLYSYHVPYPLDLQKMSTAAALLEGENDFSAFRALGTPVKTTVRRLDRLRVEKAGEFIQISLRANGFLYHMARLLAGTLLRVGLGKFPPGEVAAILAGQSSLLSGPALPARGLCLEEVEYEPNP